MRINPILNKELTVGSRSIKMSITIMVYNFILGVVSIIPITLGMVSSYNDFCGNLMLLFPVLGIAQIIIVVLIIPVITAGSIAGERERQTLDVMLTTPVKPRSIVFGKLLTASTQVLMYVLSSIPIMSMAFIIGGMQWRYLFYFVIFMLWVSLYVGSIGVFCSAKTKKTITSVILCYAIMGVIAITTFVAFIINASLLQWLNNYSSIKSYGTTLLWLLANPIVTAIDFFTKAMTNRYAIQELMVDMTRKGTLMRGICNYYFVISIIVNILIALFFLKRAAKKINPLKKVKKRKNASPQQPAVNNR